MDYKTSKEIEATIREIMLGEAKDKGEFSDEQFQKDLKAVRDGKADREEMADKWGARGGAFLNGVKLKLKNKSKNESVELTEEQINEARFSWADIYNGLKGANFTTEDAKAVMQVLESVAPKANLTESRNWHAANLELKKISVDELEAILQTSGFDDDIADAKWTGKVTKKGEAVFAVEVYDHVDGGTESEAALLSFDQRTGKLRCKIE